MLFPSSGFVLGLLAGGLLAEIWHVIFYVLAGLSLLCVAFGWVALPNDDETLSPNPSDTVAIPPPLPISIPKPRPSIWMFDWLGSLLSTAGLVLLTFTLADAEASPKGWNTPYIPALLPVSVLLLVAFQGWESYLEKMSLRKEAGLKVGKWFPRPLLPPSIWKAPKFSAVIASEFKIPAKELN